MKRKAEQILKVDVIGRVWTPRGQREAVLDEFERSGMAGTKFAEHIGVKYPTFASWVQKRRRERGAAVGGLCGSGAPKALEWVEAAVETGRCRGGSVVLCVDLPGGARMEIGDGAQAAMAAELLCALAARDFTGAVRC